MAHGAAHAPGDSGGDGSAPSGGSLRADAACLRPGRRLPPPFLPPMFSQLFSSCHPSLGCFFGSPSACLARGAQQDRSCLSCGAPWATPPALSATCVLSVPRHLDSACHLLPVVSHSQAAPLTQIPMGEWFISQNEAL